MKIALTHPYSWPEVRRGAERIIVETARALAGRGHDVTIFSAGSSSSTVIDGGVRTVRFRRRFRRDWMHERWFGWRVAPHLVAGRFDATHSFMPHDALAAVRTRRLGGHRTLYDEMGVPWLVWDRLRDGAARAMVVDRVDVYACMSQYALAALRAHSDRPGVRLPGGVRLTEFTPAAARETSPTVLFSGAFDVPFKGVAGLLDALALVAEQRPDVRLWLSGPGDGSKLLAAAPEAARERTEILPLGEPADQPQRYGRAWVTAQPSVRESFGMVMLESLACGTPIVTTDDGALQELVSPTTGVVAKAGDAASLADALLRAFDLAADPSTAAACRASAEPYDWDTGIAPLLEDLYGPGRRR
ncbi:MAG: glycosyltransferase family 4 protein [Acidimicrobiales bacterium]